MALLMAGMCPEYFKCIASYVPITDLETWVEQNKKYAPNVLACCSDSAEQMKKRSPINYLDTIARANLKIFHGKFDPVVPFTHSLNLYNALIEKYPDARVYLDIFDGGHEINIHIAMHWILSQYNQTNNASVTG